MRPSTRLVVLGRKLWTPANILTALWLDAADFSTITLNESTVSEWRDKSGNGRHASQATVANQPTYQATGFNGKPMLTFDGVNDILSIASTNLFSSGNANLSAFFVYSPSLPQTVSGATIFANYLQGQFQLAYSSGLAYLSPWGVWNNSPLDLATGSYLQNQRLIIGAIRDSGVFTGYTDGNINLSVANNDSVYNGADTQSPWYIAANSAGGELGNIDLTEIVLLNSALSTTNRQLLEGYLAWKWGLEGNLPSDHPFKFTPPIA